LQEETAMKGAKILTPVT